MIKILLTLFIFFALSANSFAKEIIYLKCPEIVKKNNSVGVFKDFSPAGKEMGRNYVKITVLKSSARIKLHSAFGDYPSKEKLSEGGPSQKSKLEDGKYTWEDLFSNELIGMVNKFYFSKVNGIWKFTGISMIKDKKKENRDTRYTIAANCEELSKKKI